MRLSELPELREYRDELARARGGGAVAEANIAAQRVFDKAIRGTGKPRGLLSDRAVREAVASTVAGVRRGTGAIASPGGKPGRKRKAGRISKKAVRRAVRKALNAAGPARAPARQAGGVQRVQATAPAGRPLHELSAEELRGRLAESFAAARTATPAASHVAESAGVPGKPLHELDQESWERHFGAVMTAQATETLVSPFARGPGAVSSPFWRDR